MKIIISPTKQMTNDQDFFFPESQPIFLTQTKKIFNQLVTLSYSEAKKMWHCSDKLAQENYERLHEFGFNTQTAPAIMSYKGIQYQYMAPDLLTKPALEYLQEHVRILSGFYGILRPFDAIIPYRLEMQAPLAVEESTNLYKFWGNQIYEALDFSNHPVVNLASKEYSKAITPFLKETDQLINIHFYHVVDDKLKVKATIAKMARGEMVRYLAENQVTTLEGIKNFEHPHYHFSAEHSTDNAFVFIFQE